MNIQHSIPAIGHKCGSIGWLADLLDDTTLTVAETKSGVTALFADSPEEDGLTFVARPYASPEDEYHSHYSFQRLEINGQPFKVAPVTGYEDGIQEASDTALFGALTPAAREAATKWRDKAVEAFAEQWARDGEDDSLVTVELSSK